ncbi:MAG: helix-turn-helix domain-containing protein [Bythopirellula sp.]
MSRSSTLPPDLPALHGANVRRLMARHNMTQSEVVRATGLDERTIRSVLRGVTRPQARTLYKLAEGLGVDTDELFQDPYQAADGACSDRASIDRVSMDHDSDEQACLSAFEFDRATNPIAAEVVDAHPELFESWTAAEFSELFSRMAVGGELTEAGTLASVQTMNDRRQLMCQVAIIMESSEAELMRDFVKLLFDRVTTIEDTKK